MEMCTAPEELDGAQGRPVRGLADCLGAVLFLVCFTSASAICGPGHCGRKANVTSYKHQPEPSRNTHTKKKKEKWAPRKSMSSLKAEQKTLGRF